MGDVDADGYGDLICVYPPGAAIIDVSLSEKGQKAGVPFQALTGWGKDCQAAIAGEFDDKPGADVAGLFGGDTVRLAGGFENGKYKDVPDWVKLPRRLRADVACGRQDPDLLAQGSRGVRHHPRDPRRVPLEAPVPPPFDPKAWGLRSEDLQWLTADMDRDGDEDVVEFPVRNGAPHRPRHPRLPPSHPGREGLRTGWRMRRRRNSARTL